MNIGFDISQTGSGKAGCGYYTHAMIKAMLAIAPQHHYALYPSFGDFYFDAKMPVLNPYRGEHVKLWSAPPDARDRARVLEPARRWK